jgi:cysteinyl-tRNA synthetase
VHSYEEYGRLSGRSVEDMIAGARVEVAPYKRDPMDFVLWKPSSDDQPGWDSPWGRGRPGWHIECSAMSHALLGESFDIHGGGIDLQFPHHENEIAQSCCAHPEGGFARIWMHNEMLQVEGKKMSKSLGNFFTVRDLLDQGVPGEVIRFVMLSTHYSKPMDWTEKKREEAEKTLRNGQALDRRLRLDSGRGAPMTRARLPSTTPPSATGSRRKACSSPRPRNSASPRRSTPSGSTISKAAGPGRTPPTARFSTRPRNPRHHDRLRHDQARGPLRRQ